MTNLKYSIVIATYNRLDELKELFSSAIEMDFDAQDFEFVIADDGSSDGTQEYIETLSTPFSVMYLKQKNQGPGKARNLAMTNAQGEYFIFIDSDCIFPQDYLRQVDNFLQNNPVDAFGGPDDCHPKFPPMLKAINYSMTSFIGTGGTRGSEKSVTRFYPRSFNMGIRRKIFEDIGGMNDLRHGQDMDYSARIYNAGYTVALIPKAKVYHKRRTNLNKFFKQIFNWGVARINLGKMYPYMLKPVHLLPAVIVAMAIIILVTAPFFTLSAYLLKLGLLATGGLALFAFLQSLIQYRSLQVSILSIFTLFIQIFAYGLGTWSGIWQRITGKSTAKGFTKNYYK